MATYTCRLARTINIRFIYGIFGREITKYTVISGVYIRFWTTLYMCAQVLFVGLASYITLCNWETADLGTCILLAFDYLFVGLARTVYIHRI
jgi:hypothetical protein